MSVFNFLNLMFMYLCQIIAMILGTHIEGVDTCNYLRLGKKVGKGNR